MRTIGPDQKRALASLLLRVDGRMSTPLHEQIYEGVRARILAGAALPGTRLPSSRQLAAELSVARTTVLQALEALAAEGYVVARQRSGVRVAPALPVERLPAPGRRTDRPALPPRLSTAAARAVRRAPAGAPRLGGAPRAFRPGVPALDLFPTALWARIVGQCCGRASAQLLDGGDAAGHAGLRRAIAEHVSAARAVSCSPEQVFVTGGTQQALEEVLRLVLDPGDAVWVEDPGYLGARRAVAATHGRAVAVPVDDEGLDVAAGTERAPHARAVVLSPSHHYPLGVTLSLPRRMALLRWAAERRVLVVEDDYDSEFRYRGRPLMALQGLDEAGRVVYMGTFSKTLFPGLRVGFLVVPPALVEAVRATRSGVPSPAAALEQAALARFIADGHFARHLRRMRTAYRERGEALVEALRAACGGALDPRPCDTGMQLAAGLRGQVRDAAVRDEAARLGIEVAPLSDYFLGRPRMSGLVFGFGGVRPAAIRAGVQALARALERAGAG
jgi:GntR family transcriptional regulator/MocR family aminotransferase